MREAAFARAEHATWQRIVERNHGIHANGAHAGKRKVLVIEDNADAATHLRKALEHWEHAVEVACSGPEGLEKARQFDPDFVLCALSLHGMDGYDVARAFRADERLRR